jgi:uncharacterized surface protein with fasciclin (FAS1) repeats
MKAFKLTFVALITLGLAPFSTLADTCSASQTSYTATKKTIVGVAASTGTFNTLVAAVKAADLVKVLESDGPFTVFAPTDEAFAKLPKGTVETLLKPENRDKLVAILKYHVVPGKVTSSDVKPGKAKTASGKELTLALVDGKVKVDQATVIKADVDASNGVIHVIDQVVLPQS